MPEPMHVPQKGDDEADTDDKFSVGSDADSAPTLPELDHFDSLWKFTPHPTGDITPPLPSNSPKPKTTRRHRQTVALLEEFHVTYMLIKEVFDGLPYNSQHWSEVMTFYYRVRSFVNEGSDKYFYYKDQSNVAIDANFGDAKIAVDELMEEWGKLRKSLEEDGMIGQMVFEECWEETVPRSFL